MTAPDVFPDALSPCHLAAGLHIACLPNGMRVIIREDHRSPVAICNLWVRVGSNREPEKLRGWSHGIEHMLFKGTTRRDESDFAREVAEAGGTTNAGTGYETTNYHITLPAQELPIAVDILADVLFDSTFDPASLDAERQVLLHENHMYDDIPFGFGVTWRWGMELAFGTSPYRHPIGGRDENLLERDRDDILAFFRSAYRPDNMTAVIVGDVDPQEAFDLLAARFGTVPNAEAGGDESVHIVADPPVEIGHDACRLRVEYGDIERAYAKLIFAGPGEQDPRRPAVSVTRRALSDGRSARLYRRVQEEQKLVDQITVLNETGPREGIFIVDMETDPQRLAAAVSAVAGVLADLGRNGCTEQELDRARIRAVRSFRFGEETVQGQASTMGYNDALGDLARAFDYPERIAGVTSDDVAAFCADTFTRNGLSCVIYLPEGTDAAAAGIPTDAAQLETLLEPILPAAPAEAKRPAIETFSGRGAEDAGAPIARTVAAAPPRFETTLLPCGTPVHCRLDPSVPVVAMAFTARGGATGESAREAGLSTLMQMAQVKGAGDLDAEALHETLEGEGASLGPKTDRDSSGLFLSSLSDRLDHALDLAGLVINEPTFPEEEIEQERRLALEQLASLRDNPFQAAAVKLREMVYGDHPYGRPLVGTAESLPELDREMLIARWRQAWRPANLQVVVSGQFDRDHVLERLASVIGRLADSKAFTTAPALAPIAPPEGIVTARIERQQNQSVVLTAWPGPATPDEDRVPLLLLKEILNGQSGRLFEHLRNRNSLCYNTGAINTAGFGQGMFLGYVLTAPESQQEALEALVQVLRSAADDPARGGEISWGSGRSRISAGR